MPRLNSALYKPTWYVIWIWFLKTYCHILPAPCTHFYACANHWPIFFKYSISWFYKYLYLNFPYMIRYLWTSATKCELSCRYSPKHIHSKRKSCCLHSKNLNSMAETSIHQSSKFCGISNGNMQLWKRNAFWLKKMSSTYKMEDFIHMDTSNDH